PHRRPIAGTSCAATEGRAQLTVSPARSWRVDWRGKASELARKTGGVLLSQALASQVPSALRGLTSLFGMGRGVSPSLRPPEKGEIAPLAGCPDGLSGLPRSLKTAQ